jgi:hypothetical protein
VAEVLDFDLTAKIIIFVVASVLVFPVAFFLFLACSMCFAGWAIFVYFLHTLAQRSRANPFLPPSLFFSSSFPSLFFFSDRCRVLW